MSSAGCTIALNEARCINCKACEIHCQNYNAAAPDLRLGLHLAEGPVKENGRFVMRMSFISCRHCADAPCVATCPTGAMRKRDRDGLVFVQKDLCQGCEACRMVCPWHVPQLDKSGVIAKCDGCLGRVDLGEMPACVEACAAHALTVSRLP